MMRSQIFATWTRVLVVISAALGSTTFCDDALAFGEDVCVPRSGGPIGNCATLPAQCLPVGTTSPACRVAATAAFVREGITAGALARSTVHADSTHLIAQIVGFSADDAYWISAYNEVCDYGVFEAFDANGNPVDSGSLKTANLNGLVRTNTAVGGTFFHFVPFYNQGSSSPPPGFDGLHPDPSNAAVEYFLAEVRRWALSQGDRDPLCTAGLTTLGPNGSYGTGTTCYPAATSPNISWTMSAIASIDAPPFANDTGSQVLVSGDAGAVATAADFDAVVGGSPAHISDARMGIYLHALADRISHHACIDHAPMAGPTSGAWSESWSNTDCDQGMHALYHMWETGVDFTAVPEDHQTTKAALEEVYEELVSFAAARQTLRAGASDPAVKTAVVAGLLNALREPAAIDRVDQIAKLACANGVQPFPGGMTCPDAGVLSADGGVTTHAAIHSNASRDASASGCDAGRSSSASASAALWGGVVVLAIAASRRRRRRGRDDAMRSGRSTPDLAFERHRENDAKSTRG